MQGGLGPRFALEVAFLIVLAIGAGVAQLSAPAIVVVMALAWLAICLFELTVWAERPMLFAVRRSAPVVEEEEAADEPAAVTAIHEPEPESSRRRFWRRRRPAGGGEE